MSKNYDNNIMNIVNIGFSVFTNKDILLNSSTEQDVNGITLPDSYENSEPKRNGLVDPRLGISERHLDCATCGLDSINCPGHHGHMKLEEPVFNIIFLPYVKKILSCIDLRTSKLLINTENKDRAIGSSFICDIPCIMDSGSNEPIFCVLNGKCILFKLEQPDICRW